MTGAAESYRHALETRRPAGNGGGTCTLLVRRVNGHIELLYHAAVSTGAELSDDQAVELAEHLTRAARRY